MRPAPSFIDFTNTATLAPAQHFSLSSTTTPTLVVDGKYAFVPNVVRRAIFLIHGFGTSGADMVHFIPFIAEKIPDAAIFCPTAPYRAEGSYDLPLSIDESARMWYPIAGELMALRSGRVEEIESFYGATKKKAIPAFKMLNALADKVKEEFSLKDNALAFCGFSQGGEVALGAAFTRKGQIASTIGFSTTGPCFALSDIKSRPPLLMTHGDEDVVIPYPLHKMALDMLKAFGIKPDDFLMEGAGHTITEAALAEAVIFLRKHFKLD